MDRSRTMHVKKLAYWFIYGLLMLFLSMSGLEIIYRYQLVDFYKAELKALNSEAELTSSSVDLLVFGDSFAASPGGFVDQLKEQFPDKTIINAGLVGTGIKQHVSIATKRMNRFKPKSILYQVYEGNDLLDIQYPIDWQKQTVARNIYWLVSSTFTIVPFINYRLRGLKTSSTPQRKASGKRAYSARTKMFLKANPSYIQDINQLTNGMDKAFDRWVRYWKKLEKKCHHVNTQILLIPHGHQISRRYINRYQDFANIPYDSLACPSTFYAKIQETAGDNFPIIDPCEALHKADSIQAVYFDFDPHLNTFGHSILTKEIVKAYQW